MVRSMTAYGRSFFLSTLGKWTAELYSVNKKTADCHIILPKQLLLFDPEIRKYLHSVFQRGYLTCKIFFTPDSSVLFSEARLERLNLIKKEMEKACRRSGCDESDISFPFLYEQMHTWSSDEDLPFPEEEMRKDLFSVLESAADAYLKGKESEGADLAKALQASLQSLLSLLSQMEGVIPVAGERKKAKLLSGLAEWKQLDAEDRDRVLREVFFYWEKSDITEEIVRMKAHIGRFFEVLGEERCSGKMLDFLAQEMHREANTSAAKSSDPELSLLAVAMKGEVEKIREQVQNIE